MKLSSRLSAIVKYIDDNDCVLDIGCDHGYLDIYLAKYRSNKMIIASDISEDVLSNTKNNFNKYKVTDKIKIYCTDGTKGINDNFDTIVLAGLGSYTILDILKKSKTVRKVIICSNNNWDIIRKEVTKLGYFLNEETLVLENNKLYSIMLFDHNKNTLNIREILIGKYNSINKKLYQNYYSNIEYVFNKIPNKKIFKKIKYYKMLKYLKKYLIKEYRAI